MSDWKPNRDGPWAAIDTGLLRNRKLATLKGRADVLYIAMLLHCADELTDGHVHAYVLPRLQLEARAKKADVRQLEDARLIVPAPDGDGHLVPDYLDWNPTRAWWQHKRASNAERQARYRENHRHQSRDTNGTFTPETNAPGNALHNAISHPPNETRRENNTKKQLSQAEDQLPSEPPLVPAGATEALAEHVTRSLRGDLGSVRAGVYGENVMASPSQPGPLAGDLEVLMGRLRANSGEA